MRGGEKPPAAAINDADAICNVWHNSIREFKE